MIRKGKLIELGSAENKNDSTVFFIFIKNDNQLVNFGIYFRNIIFGPNVNRVVCSINAAFSLQWSVSSNVKFG